MKKRVLIFAALGLLAVALAVGIYAGDYYRAAEPAMAAMAGSEEIGVSQEKTGTVFAPEEPTAGLIFYPGGKVEAISYAPLLRALAEKDILCVLVEMPLNLAVLDMNAAEGIPEQFPEVEDWYLAGHSLGGSMAASYAGKNSGDYRGLILLASYSTEDLTGSGLEVLSIIGDRDGVLNMEKYRKYQPNLPENAQETVISGGNHAQFGSYGLQEGDGEAAISAEAQLEATVSAILQLLKD